MQTCMSFRHAARQSRRLDHRQAHRGRASATAFAVEAGVAGAAAAVQEEEGSSSGGWGREAAVVEAVGQRLAVVAAAAAAAVVVLGWDTGCSVANGDT